MSDDITDRLRRLYVQRGTDYVQEAASTIERLRTELAAAQAREQKLREALEWYHGGEPLPTLADEALALPPDDTVLRKMIAAARRDGIEYAARLVATYPHWLGENAKQEIASAIRARGDN